MPATFAPTAVRDAVEIDDERALVADAVTGCRAAFAALYRVHAGRVFGVIVRLVGARGARAEDLTQETFIRAWQALPGFRNDAAFGTWLHRLAVNTALMDLRAHRARPDHYANREGDEDAFDTLGTPDSAGGRTAIALDLERAVATLPPRARAVLVLFDVEGWSHEQIALELDMAVGTSKAQLHRARGLLRTRLKEFA